MASERQRLKLLYLARILSQETDAEHGISMPQLIAHLSEQGIDAERKAVYKDLSALREFGMDIVKLPGRPPLYALANRDFSQAELLLLVDAVQSSRFLTQRRSDALCRSLGTLTSRHLGQELARRIHVEGRITSQNESVFANVDVIQRAIALKRKVTFRYFRYDAGKQRRFQHEGRLYLETPVALIYSDGLYYLVVYNDKHEGFAHYRVDRMVDIRVAPQSATKNEAIRTFDPATYTARIFGMFGGEDTKATLLVDEDVMGAVVDRFGKDIETTPTDDGRARVYVQVTESPTFFGWLAQFGDHVRIEQPTRLRDAYREHLAAIMKSYEY